MRTGGFDPRRLSLLIVLLLFPAGSFAAEGSASKRAEQWILQKARSGEDANLKDKFPSETDRVISASFLKQLLTSDPAKSGVRAYGVRISNASVKGALDLTNEEIPFYLELNDCFFDHDLILVSAHFKKSLHIERSIFHSLADFRYSVIVLRQGMFNSGRKISKS